MPESSKPERDYELVTIQNTQLEDLAREQEPKFLAILYRNKDLLADCIRRGITSECFRDGDSKKLFVFLARHFDTYGTVIPRDIFTSVVAEDEKEPERQSYWRTKYDNLFNSGSANKESYPFLSESIESRFLQQQAYSVVQHYFHDLLHSTENQKDIVERFQRAVGSIRSLGEDSGVKGVTLSDALEGSVWPEIEQRRESPESFIGLNSGFKSIDRVFRGFLRGKYIVFLAMENGGKTTLMLNMAHNMIMNGMHVVYITIESDVETVSKRMLTIHSAISYNRIMAGGKSEQEGLGDYAMSKLREAKEDFLKGLGKNLLWIEALQGTPFTVMEELINRKRAYTQVDAVFVDYLDVVGARSHHEGRDDLDLADVSADIQNYGKKNGILMATAQQLKTDKVRSLSGGSGKKQEPIKPEDFKVGVGDVSGSKKIAGAADYILSALIDQQNFQRMHIFTTKARNNRTCDRFSLSYDRDSGRLEDLPEDPSGYEQIAADAEHDNTMWAPPETDAPAPAEAPPVQSSLAYLETGKSQEAGSLSSFDMEPAPDAPFWGGA